MLDWEWDAETDPDRMLDQPRAMKVFTHRKLWHVAIEAAKQLNLPAEVFGDWIDAIALAEIAADEPHRDDLMWTRNHRQYGGTIGPTRQWVIEGAIYACLHRRDSQSVSDLTARIKEVVWRAAQAIVLEKHRVEATPVQPATPIDHPANGTWAIVRADQARILRDIFGNPFRPVAFAPEWRSSDAVALAAAMYESRDFGPMPVLADALEEAGCDHPDVLAHCRGAGPHVRGCWVADLVLGKA